MRGKEILEVWCMTPGSCFSTKNYLIIYLYKKWKACQMKFGESLLSPICSFHSLEHQRWNHIFICDLLNVCWFVMLNAPDPPKWVAYLKITIPIDWFSFLLICSKNKRLEQIHAYSHIYHSFSYMFQNTFSIFSNKINHMLSLFPS